MWQSFYFIVFIAFESATFCCVWSLSVSALRTVEVIIRDKSDCEKTNSIHKVGGPIDFCNVSMEWAKYNCLEKPQEWGFKCDQYFTFDAGSIENFGKRLCVDLQGVQNDIKDMNQILITASDGNDDPKYDLKRVYSITRLRPTNMPYYVCTRPGNQFLRLSLSVRSSVKMCPHIFHDLFNHTIRMGSVSLRPKDPISWINFKWCTAPRVLSGNINLIKVNTGDTLRQCYATIKMGISASYMKGCLKIEYISDDFDCNVLVRLTSENAEMGSMVDLPMEPWMGDQKCQSFSARNGNPVLVIKNYPSGGFRSCKGTFAFSINFQQTPPPDLDDPDKDSRSPNLYMAVFITLIAICLVCLGLTCLCCIRFRAKRLRRMQRRSANRPVSPLANHAFQYEVPATPGYDNIGWNPSQPAMLYGLPTYEEVVAESSSGINPSDDPSKNDLPPVYDSIYPESSET